VPVTRVVRLKCTFCCACQHIVCLQRW